MKKKLDYTCIPKKQYEDAHRVMLLAMRWWSDARLHQLYDLRDSLYDTGDAAGNILARLFPTITPERSYNIAVEAAKDELERREWERENR